MGDARQAINRFRGAAGAPTRFADDFGGETLELGHNFRSGDTIVSAFSAFSAGMRGGPGAWRAERGMAGAVTVTEAPSVAAEGAAIAVAIGRLRASGVGHGDQAVLVRTHLTLDRVGAALERRGVPLLHLGDLFARLEVRNRLAVLAVAGEPGGISLTRAAAMPPYGVPREDAIVTIRWAKRRGVTVDDALRRARSIPGLTAAGRAGLLRLGRDLDATAPDASAWSVLTTWLFETSGAILPLMMASDR